MLACCRETFVHSSNYFVAVRHLPALEEVRFSPRWRGFVLSGWPAVSQIFTYYMGGFRRWSIQLLLRLRVVAFFRRWCISSAWVGHSRIPPCATDPKPGDIYREYTRTMMSYTQWRVTGPSSSDPRAQANLPNATLSLNIGDLQGAITRRSGHRSLGRACRNIWQSDSFQQSFMDSNSRAEHDARGW